MSKADLTGASILIVEDEVLWRKQIAAHLEKMGADVTVAESLDKARRFLDDLNFDFAFLDVNLPDGVGTDLLREKRFSSSTGVIIMTAHGGVSGAVEALRLGAQDYLVKPFDPAELPLTLGRVRRNKQVERIQEQQKEDEQREAGSFFFGEALAPMRAQLDKILAADHRMLGPLPPVLIHGETGTGKTTIARWLHQRGPRSSQPLVEINCSALPETLAESELFGHERGAFTDARSARMGLFEAASGGTLFLDELPSLSPALQAKVLTAIEDQKIRRVGGNKALTIDARIIAATNQDLKSAVASGRFREDLYHRLDLYRIEIPPLRARGEDIVRLAEQLLEHLAVRHRLTGKTIHETGRQQLRMHPWPGNVRELSHEIERALVFEDQPELRFERLLVRPDTSVSAPRGSSAALDAAATTSEWFNPAFVFPREGFVLEEAINHLLQHALRQTNQNVSAAARLLGVSRDYVRYRLSGAKEGDRLPAGPDGDETAS